MMQVRTGCEIILCLALGTMFSAQALAAESADLPLSIPLEVRNLPKGARFVPVSAGLDFGKIAKELNLAGTVDLHSLRMHQEESSGQTEIPFQFVSDPQRRVEKRSILPGTSTSVSYVGEYAGENVPPEFNFSGKLHWVAGNRSDGPEKFILKVMVRSGGRFVQVPYPPHDLHAFSENGKATSPRWYPTMQIRPLWPLEGRVQFFDVRDLVTGYQLGPSFPQTNGPFRRPFLYPVNGPDGIPLTELGKPHDPSGSHAHHYSLWVAHVDVNGHNFWGEKNGLIAHDELVATEDGAIFSLFTHKTRWIDGGADILREQRTIKVYKEFGDFRIIDIELEFKPPGTEAVTFGKTSFGFLAARVRQSMTVFDGGGEIRNAEGDLNEQGAHLKAARWIDQSGPVSAERWGGIAMFDSPDNPNHPTTWHCRNDGWAGASFNAREAYQLAPGKSLKLKYRVHLHKHDAIRGEVARRFEEFVAKPEVVFGKATITGR